MSMSQYVNVLICQGLYSTYISMAHNVNVFINQERNTYVLYIIVYCIVYYTIHSFKGSKKQLINQYIYPGLDMSMSIGNLLPLDSRWENFEIHLKLATAGSMNLYIQHYYLLLIRDNISLRHRQRDNIFKKCRVAPKIVASAQLCSLLIRDTEVFVTVSKEMDYEYHCIEKPYILFLVQY